MDRPLVIAAGVVCVAAAVASLRTDGDAAVGFYAATVALAAVAGIGSLIDLRRRQYRGAAVLVAVGFLVVPIAGLLGYVVLSERRGTTPARDPDARAPLAPRTPD